jgi:hypothetical protein
MIEDIVQKRINALKLLAETDKLHWDRRIAPWVIASSLISGIVVAIISHLWK